MIYVTKADGTHEPFSRKKLLHSIKRAGIPAGEEIKVIEEISKELYNGITTSEIYQKILSFLTSSPQPYYRSRYSLKQAIMLFGPTGYPFEDFVARILNADNFETTTRQILQGKCVTHEIDVVARNDQKKIMVEAKFHNRPGVHSDVHVALYTKARFEDIKIKYHLDEAWIVTNTKATNDAIAFAECAGMKIVSWSYPEGKSLRDLVAKFNMQPITALTTLSSFHKTTLLKNHIILCKELISTPQILDSLGFTPQEKEKIISEASFLLEE